SIEMVEAVLAVLKTGAAYIPLDPGFPDDRLAFMVEDSGIRLLVTQKTLVKAWPPSVRPVDVDSDADVYASADVDGSWPRAFDGASTRPEHLAYVIYTSGSTGRPKGVQVTHGALANFLRSMQRRPGFE